MIEPEAERIGERSDPSFHSEGNRLAKKFEARATEAAYTPDREREKHRGAKPLGRRPEKRGQRDGQTERAPEKHSEQGVDPGGDRRDECVCAEAAAAEHESVAGVRKTCRDDADRQNRQLDSTDALRPQGRDRRERAANGGCAREARAGREREAVGQQRRSQLWA